MVSREVIEGFGVKAVEGPDGVKPDCVILAVAHEQFKVSGDVDIAKIIKDCLVVVDVKGLLKGNDICTL